MSLPLIQDAILALHAAGDPETAAWLASIADDPEQVARLVGGADRAEGEEDGAADDGRWLLEHGYTGTVTDAAGRKQTYVDGRHVAGQGADSGGKADPGAGARTSTHTSHEEDAAEAARQHDAAPAGERGAFGKARAAIHAKLSKTAGGRAVLAMGKGGAYLFHKVERPLLYALHKTNEVAVAAAKERGLSDEAAAKLKRVLMAADFFGGYATGGAALAATGSVWAAKVAAVMPSASVAYLAYSTARSPLSTWRAAKKVVAETFAKTGATTHESEQDELRITPELAGMIADRIGRGDVESEWWVACFHAALAHTNGDAERAIELADAAVEAMPQEPAGE